VAILDVAVEKGFVGGDQYMCGLLVVIVGMEMFILVGA